MAFDPEGTSPGLVQGTPSPKVINFKCREEGCTSLQAVEIKSGGQENPSAGIAHNRTYQCVRCRHTFTLAVGGAVNF